MGGGVSNSVVNKTGACAAMIAYAASFLCVEIQMCYTNDRTFREDHARYHRKAELFRQPIKIILLMRQGQGTQHGVSIRTTQSCWSVIQTAGRGWRDERVAQWTNSQPWKSGQKEVREHRSGDKREAGSRRCDKQRHRQALGLIFCSSSADCGGGDGRFVAVRREQSWKAVCEQSFCRNKQEQAGAARRSFATRSVRWRRPFLLRTGRTGRTGGSF